MKTIFFLRKNAGLDTVIKLWIECNVFSWEESCFHFFNYWIFLVWEWFCRLMRRSYSLLRLRDPKAAKIFYLIDAMYCTSVQPCSERETEHLYSFTFSLWICLLLCEVPISLFTIMFLLHHLISIFSLLLFLFCIWPFPWRWVNISSILE